MTERGELDARSLPLSVWWREEAMRRDMASTASKIYIYIYVGGPKIRLRFVWELTRESCFGCMINLASLPIVLQTIFC